MGKFEEQLISAMPNERQLKLLEMGYYNFIHFGLNTFTKKEWGNGKVDPSEFKLESLDTDKWVQQLMATGSKGVILTAKHHDGFCLFPSKYTDYTIAYTPYKNGKGDIVGELSKSCKKYGFKLGIYLSPWDRHEKTYGTEEYNDYFCHQLMELCTNYGEIFCFWFDGACGEGANGKKQRYDWDRYFATIHKYQSNCIISNCGLDARWIGNEAGVAREAEWAVVPKRLQCFDEVMRASQQQEGAFVMRKISNTDKNLGSRETIYEGEEMVFWPAEMDISVTKIGWFYRKWFETFYARSVKNLVNCYCTSVGNNATLLVNIPPNTQGELPTKFIDRLIRAREKVENMFAKPIDVEFEKVNDSLYKANLNGRKISKVVLMEDLTKSQRVEEFEIVVNGAKVFDGKTIGYKKFCMFEEKNANEVVVRIKQSRGTPFILKIKAYE